MAEVACVVVERYVDLETNYLLTLIEAATTTMTNEGTTTKTTTATTQTSSTSFTTTTTATTMSTPVGSVVMPAGSDVPLGGLKAERTAIEVFFLFVNFK